jgi:hypothetical protein
MGRDRVRWDVGETDGIGTRIGEWDDTNKAVLMRFAVARASRGGTMERM